MANELPGAPVRAYIGCCWFNEQQQAHMKAGLAAIEENPTVSRELSHYPLDFAYNGIDVTQHPEVMKEVEWQARTYTADIEGIMGADLGIMLFTPQCPDDGMAFEMGYLRACHKQTVLVIPDEDQETTLNLMIAYGVSRIIPLSELATFDFRHVVSGTYHGTVI